MNYFISINKILKAVLIKLKVIITIRTENKKNYY